VTYARFGSRTASGVVEVTDDIECLDRGGFWAVVVTFEGDVRCVRLAEVTGPEPLPARTWTALQGDWRSSLDQAAYQDGVRQIRERIAAGQVYQVNLCRVMSHPLADEADLAGLEALVTVANPAPHAGRLFAPEAGLDLLSASPEAFLIRRGGRIESRPIKGTATTLSMMLAKDYAENVMIADLVRNDLSVVCRPGTVSVDALCAPEEHPGLTHLVTTVSGELSPDVGWAEIMSATFPPGSVTGAPKSSALRVLTELETAPRAGRTAGRSAGWMRTPGMPSWPSGSERSGQIGTPPGNVFSGSAPGEGSPGVPILRRSGLRQS